VVSSTQSCRGRNDQSVVKEVKTQGNQSKGKEGKEIGEVVYAGADPSTVTREALRSPSLWSLRLRKCRIVRIVQRFSVIEPYGTEIRKRLKAELVFMQCPIECDVEALAGTAPSRTNVTTRSRENRHVKTAVEM
jgi:hypothetical protein